jgi:26S proteasome regulatory subunit N5
MQVEYARCVLMIVKGKEDENDILEAASILQEVQVETYGSMDKREKLEFILYQMKIMLKRQDYVRFYIISKKINENNINDDEIADLKTTYFSYMAIYFNHENRFADACKAYRIIWETLKSTKKTIPETLDFHFSAKQDDVLSNYIGFLALQPYTEANHKELTQLSEKEELEVYPTYLTLINRLLQEEIVSCDVSDYSPDSFELFRDSYPNAKVHAI